MVQAQLAVSQPRRRQAARPVFEAVQIHIPAEAPGHELAGRRRAQIKGPFGSRSETAPGAPSSPIDTASRGSAVRGSDIHALLCKLKPMKTSLNSPQNHH